MLDPALVYTRYLVDATGSRSLIELPLLALNRLIGVLTCALPAPHRLSQPSSRRSASSGACLELP